MNFPVEIPKTCNECLLSAADTVIGYTKNPRGDVNPSKCQIIEFNTTFLRIIWNNATTYETDNIIKSINIKHSNRYNLMHYNSKINAPFIVSP